MEATKTNNSLIKNALLFEKEIFCLALPDYAKRLKVFERKHSMTSDEFFEKFQSGAFGDDPEWFDWLFQYKAYKHLKERLKSMESLV